MVKGYKKDGKFIPTGTKHVGIGKEQIKSYHETPSSIGNEMLIRKKLEIDKSKKYDVKELYKIEKNEHGHGNEQVCSVCGQRNLNFVEDHIRDEHPELLKEKRDKQELEKKKIADDIKVTFEEVDQVKVENDGRTIGWATKYEAKVTYNGKSRKFEFTDSVNANNNGEDPKPYDVLYSLSMDISGSDDKDEFFSEFGYDEDSHKAHMVFDAVQEEKKKMNALFTENELEMLQEDFQDY